MATTVGARTAYLVRHNDRHLVAVFWGADAPEEAASWNARGYLVEQIDATAVV